MKLEGRGKVRARRCWAGAGPQALSSGIWGSDFWQPQHSYRAAAFGPEEMALWTRAVPTTHLQRFPLPAQLGCGAADL